MKPAFTPLLAALLLPLYSYAAREADELATIKQFELNTRAVRSLLATAQMVTKAAVKKKADGTLDVWVDAEADTFAVRAIRVNLENGLSCLVMPTRPFAVDEPLPEASVDCRKPRSS